MTNVKNVEMYISTFPQKQESLLFRRGGGVVNRKSKIAVH